MDALERIAAHRIIPVVAIDNAADADPLADALIAGGLPVIEITFRTEAAEAAIRALRDRADFVLGAGTVLNVDTAKRAVDAGAKFIVAPGLNPKVVSWCVENKMPIAPGVATPTEIEMALDHGINVVKFFPAELLGGLKMLEALSAPYPMIRFIPTGGIGPANVVKYLRFKKVLACGGSWIVSKQLLADRQFAKVQHLAAEAVQTADSAK